MKAQSFRSRGRLFGLLLAFVLTLGALAASPAAATIICQEGCIAWDIENGCTRHNICCVDTENGAWACIEY